MTLNSRRALSPLRERRKLNNIPEYGIQRPRRCTLTGLKDDDLGCLAIMIASWLLEAAGIIGIAIGPHGQRYSESFGHVRSTGQHMAFLKCHDPKIELVQRQDVEAWVRKRRETYAGQPSQSRTPFEVSDFVFEA